MATIKKSKCTLDKMNDAVSNPALASAAVIALVLGLVSISGVIQHPQRMKQVVTLLNSKITVGSVMNSDYSYGRVFE